MRSFLSVRHWLPAAILLCASMANTQVLPVPPSGDNQRCAVTQYIGSIVHITVTYNSPDVTGPDGMDRTGKIWGTPVAHYGLVDQGFGNGQPAPWRAGANEATVFECSHPVAINGQPLPAGRYALYLELAEKGPWTWVFSSHPEVWGSYFYDPKDVVLRVATEPTDHPRTEWLTYVFTDRQPEAATLELQWELKSVPMRITVPGMTDIYVRAIQDRLDGSTTGFNHQPWVDAARFLLERNERLDQALTWIDFSINDGFVGRREFDAMTIRAQILLRMGRQEDGYAAIAEALELPGIHPNEIHTLGRSLIATGQKEEALRVFHKNFDRFQGAWPTNVGMARGLSALGRFKEAIPYAEAALSQAPDSQNQAAIRAMVDKLKDGRDIN